MGYRFIVLDYDQFWRENSSETLFEFHLLYVETLTNFGDASGGKIGVKNIRTSEQKRIFLTQQQYWQDILVNSILREA